MLRQVLEWLFENLGYLLWVYHLLLRFFRLFRNRRDLRGWWRRVFPWLCLPRRVLIWIQWWWQYGLGRSSHSFGWRRLNGLSFRLPFFSRFLRSFWLGLFWGLQHRIRCLHFIWYSFLEGFFDWLEFGDLELFHYRFQAFLGRPHRIWWCYPYQHLSLERWWINDIGVWVISKEFK